MGAPELVASTNDVYSCSIIETPTREQKTRDASFPPLPTASSTAVTEEKEESNYFKSIQWSADGTSLITNSADNCIRCFIAPPDLLSLPTPHHLSPYTVTASPEPISATSAYPLFSLSDPTTTLVLASVRDLPLQLHNVLSPLPSATATYPLINPQTEVFETPSSLTWHPDGTAIYAGTDSLISVFDPSRPGAGPATRLPTIPSKRHKLKGGGVGMRGIVSALALQPAGGATPGTSAMLAAGTWTRWVSLYDAEGMGGTVSQFGVAAMADREAGIGGGGVSQVVWSPCGRYLLVAERRSRGVLVFDVRVQGRLLGWLEGRHAETNQRMGIDVVSVDGGLEVWAGGTDGVVRSWTGVDRVEGRHGPDGKCVAHGEGTSVGGVAMHGCGSVLATASGMRRVSTWTKGGESDDDDDGNSDGASESESDDGSDAIDEDASRVSTSESRSSVSSSTNFGTHDTGLDNSVKIWSIT